MAAAAWTAAFRLRLPAVADDLPWRDAAHLLYEDGDQGLIPLSDFKAPKSA